MAQQKDWCSHRSTQVITSYYLGQSSYLGRNNVIFLLNNVILVIRNREKTVPWWKSFLIVNFISPSVVHYFPFSRLSIKVVSVDSRATNRK